MEQHVLHINRVNLELLNERREILGEVLYEKEAGRPLELSPEQADALEGIINMLDRWSDDRYHKREAKDE